MEAYTCCNYNMDKIVSIRVDGVLTNVYWCHQCGRVIKRAGLDDMFVNTVFTPVDNYKGCNRECL